MQRQAPVYEDIRRLALSLQGMTMPIPLLAPVLNLRGHRTTYGTPYAGGRGTYRLVKCAYYYTLQNYGEEEAELVKDSFTDLSGQHAF